MRIPAFALLLVSFSAAFAEGSEKFSLTFTNDLLFQRNSLATEQGMDELKPNQFQEAFSVLGNYRFEGGATLTGGLTARSMNFYKEYWTTTLRETDSSLYRKYLRLTADGLNLQLGDFNTVMGRGLVLSVVQNDAILKDWTILGADAHYQKGGWTFHALSGTVSNNMPHLNQRSLQVFQKWSVLGGEASVEFLKGNRLGYHLSRIDDKDAMPGIGLGQPFSKGRRLTQSLSLEGSNLLGALDYYVEAGSLRFQDQSSTIPFPHLDPTKGKALYSTTAYHRGGLFLMAEYKRYEHFDNELNNPPLADRGTEVVNKNDSSGQRLLAQYTFANPDLTLFASGGRYLEGDLFLQRRFSGSNVYGGFKLEDWHDRISASYTYGFKTTHKDPGVMIGNYPERRSEATFSYKFTPKWSLDLSLKDRRRKLIGQEPWQQSDYHVQLSHSPLWAVFYTHQFLSETGTKINPFTSHHLYSGGFRVNLPKGSYLEFSGGKMHGGEVCSGGQCVTLEAFKGWKFDTHIRF